MNSQGILVSFYEVIHPLGTISKSCYLLCSSPTLYFYSRTSTLVALHESWFKQFTYFFTLALNAAPHLILCLKEAVVAPFEGSPP